MNEKKLKLMEEGLSLFADKGYHATSIQEIASKANMSKGAFYLYYQSKEDFVVTSIDYISSNVRKRMEQINMKNVSPRESLAQQIAMMINYLNQYKVFITMFMTESISIGKNFDTLIDKVQQQNVKWMKTSVKALYDFEEAEDFVMDAIIQFDGLLAGYFKSIVMHDIDVDYQDLGRFLVRRLDDMVHGMLSRETVPLIDQKHMASLTSSRRQDVTDIFQSMEEKINVLPVESKKKTQLTQVLTTLIQETEREKKNPVLLQGLLVHFNPYPILHEECQRLAELWGIDLLQ